MAMGGASVDLMAARERNVGQFGGGGGGGGGRLGRRQMSLSLLALGSGPQVGVVGGVALQRPAVVVHEPVVERAQPGGVVEGGGAAVSSPPDVVQLDDVAAAVGERAASTVAQVGGAALGDGELAVGLADVEDVPVAAEHDRDDLRVAREPPRGRGRDGRAV